MDLKTFVGKNLLFIGIIAFIMLFIFAFGEENVLIGVMMITAALMMLSKNLTGKPVKSTLGLIAVNSALGIGSLLASIDPWLGLVSNFAVVFGVSFVMMQDIKSPVYFPFLLGYAFILASPVSIGEFPLRFLSLIAGSIFIVLINVIVNHKRLQMSCHAGISGLLSEIKAICEKSLAGEPVDKDHLLSKSKLVRSAVYDRLYNKYSTSLGTRSAVNLATSAEELGKAVIDVKHTKEELEDLIKVLNDLIDYQDSKAPFEKVHASILSFIDNHHSANYRIISSLRIIDYELQVLISTDKETLYEYTDSEIPKSFRYVTILRENLRKDSLKFSFAFRMAFLVALWQFIGDYWNLENAKWLTFTTVAVVQPYLEATISKSAQRVKGTLIGVAIFTVLAYAVLLKNPDLTPVALIAISYVYSIADPKRYDIMMIFITLMALLTASMMLPTETSILERLLYILLGIAAAMLGSRIILPYRLKNETLELFRRAISINRGQIEDLKNVASDCVDDAYNAALVLTAHTISEKIKINNDENKDDVVEELAAIQAEISNQCSFLRQTIQSIPENNFSLNSTKSRILEIIDKYLSKDIPKDAEQLLSDLSAHGRDYIAMLLNILRMQNESEKLFMHLISSAEHIPKKKQSMFSRC